MQTINHPNINDLRAILEDIDKPKKIVLEPLSYGLADLQPILPKSIVDYHYTFLSQGYVDRYNKGISKDFNFAGAYLHKLYFNQFQKYKSNNKPFGDSLNIINRIYGSFDKFTSEFVEIGSKIEGSGWTILTDMGEIKTIPNHKVRKDIVVAIDCWEHAIDEYGKYKKEYLKNVWKIVNWSIVNARF